MGCVNSRTDINDLHPNIFQVMNVDDLGNLITPGQLEITEGDIILYQRDKQPIKWPLCYLRRYGYDAEIFSFESGRKCSTGQGIYAFKCRRAEDLFNLVQTNIQSCNNIGDDTVSRELPIASHPGPTRITSPSEPSYLEPTPVRNSTRTNSRFSHSQQNGGGRLGSIGSSTGPLSPGAVVNSPSPPPMLPHLPPPPPPVIQSQTSLYVNEEVLLSLPLGIENNNNESLQRTIPRSHTISGSTHNSGFGTNSEVTPMQQNLPSHSKPTRISLASYVNIDMINDVSPLSPNHSASETVYLKESNETEGSNHSYMNINPSQEYSESTNTKIRPPPLPPLQQSESEEAIRHCYVNLEPSEIEVLKHRIHSNSVSEKSPLPPSTPSGTAIREVNYAILDLNKKDSPSGSTDNGSNALQSPSPESPNKTQKGYAMIDFNKTAALSHSVQGRTQSPN